MIQFLSFLNWKKGFLSILMIAVIIFTILSNRGIQTVSAVDPTQKMKAEFSIPLSTSELATLTKQYRVLPTELYYVQGDIQGGYTISKGENIDKAIMNLLDAHSTFLSIVISQTREDIGKATDKATIERLSALYTQFTTALHKFNNGEFVISAIEVSDSQAIEALRKSGLVTHAISSRKNENEDKLHSNKGGESVSVQSISHETWAPYGGTSDVQKTYTYQTFYFNKISDYGSISTYEHETQVYDKNFADYAKYWSSNMPSAYYDTPFADSIDNFTVGTFKAASLLTYTQYFTYMSLKAGSAKNATVRIKGQKGHRSPSWCYSTWCVFPDATTGSMAVFTAPGGMSWQY